MLDKGIFVFSSDRNFYQINSDRHQRWKKNCKRIILSITYNFYVQLGKSLASCIFAMEWSETAPLQGWLWGKRTQAPPCSCCPESLPSLRPLTCWPLWTQPHCPCSGSPPCPARMGPITLLWCTEVIWVCGVGSHSLDTCSLRAKACFILFLITPFILQL